jgi:hypothetical protein
MFIEGRGYPSREIRMVHPKLFKSIAVYWRIPILAAQTIVLENSMGSSGKIGRTVGVLQL